MVVALLAVTGCVASSVSAFGVFLPVLSEAFGWSRGAISVALSINMFWGGLAAFAISGVVDRRGPRGVLAVTVLAGGVGFALTACVSELWHFYLTYGMLVGLGMSSIYVLTSATVSRWFDLGRGLALAVVLSGFNLGWLVGGPLAAFLIGRWGWRTAYVVLGVVVILVGVPASLCVRYPAARASSGAGGVASASRSARATFRDALADPRLWYLVSSWGLLGLVFMMVSVHSVSYGKDRGLPLEQASLILTAFGIGAAAGRLLAGAASDRFGVSLTMRWCVLVQGAALLILVAGPPSWAL
ncbi:MAG TPA: MFS transporter, partial [Candidatus Limnocylindrales bacterium]|nr:MFS transporter [Candidatus Limnocylindrales bacterium]